MKTKISVYQAYVDAVLVFLISVGMLLSLGAMQVQAAPDISVVQELSKRLNALEREMDELRGENERLDYELDRLKVNQRKGFLSIDERLAKRDEAARLANGQPAQPAIKPVSAAATTPATVTTPAVATAPAVETTTPPNQATSKPVTSERVKVTSNVEKAAYNDAYATLKKSSKAGVAEFNAFLKNYPSSSLAENAHYWIGEAHYAQKNYRGAIDAFVVVLNKYKAGRKAPDAAVKLGYSFYALKDWTLARRTFNDVLRHFPGSNAAKLAQARLNRMREEKH